MATIGVFLALGGGAYAAINLPNNSVGTRHIKPNAIGGGKVNNNSLSGSDIRERTFQRVPLAQSAHLLDGRTATSFQTRVNGACGDRRAIQSIGADGAVECVDLTSIEGEARGELAAVPTTPVDVPLTGDSTIVTRDGAVDVLYADLAGDTSTGCRVFVTIRDNPGGLDLGEVRLYPSGFTQKLVVPLGLMSGDGDAHNLTAEAVADEDTAGDCDDAEITDLRIVAVRSR